MELNDDDNTSAQCYDMERVEGRALMGNPLSGLGGKTKTRAGLTAPDTPGFGLLSKMPSRVVARYYSPLVGQG